MGHALDDATGFGPHDATCGVVLFTILLLLPLVLPTLQVHSQSHIQQALPNLAKILNESGHTKFMSLLCSTGTGCYIERQLNHTGGITLFSPTDDAFFDLNLSREQLVRLAKYHFVPEYLTMAMLDINGGFVGTMATDYIGKPYHLDFYSFGERLHAVTGIVDTQVSIMYQEFPLAIYQVDKLLLPPEIFKSLHPRRSPLGQLLYKMEIGLNIQQ
ncbi:hypothetical protein Sjap_025823 [Stephania japonica]|uniref:FAS1 domain-containing protein n=1 Tax=Stephania japonica TaxID=461633 RepID=A0AAP0E6U5_9MAGN